MCLLQKQFNLEMCKSTQATPATAVAREQGYILLFTLGVLSVIALLALSVATSVRYEARALGDEKIKLQQQYALMGAVHRGLAQLSANVSKDTKDSGQSTPDKLGKPNGNSALAFDLELNGFELHGASVDASLLPDGNLLSYEEWVRLAVVLGADDEGAQSFAKAVLQDKRAIELLTGKSGFRSIKEIVGSNTLPLPLMRGAQNNQGLDLTDLIVIGTQKKHLDINESHLVMFKILANFSNAQLGNLNTLRSRGGVSNAEAAQLLNGSTVPLRREASGFLRLNVENRGSLGSRSLGLVALIKKEGEAFQIVDSTYVQNSPSHQ
jgi:hypothetical protein